MKPALTPGEAALIMFLCRLFESRFFHKNLFIKPLKQTPDHFGQTIQIGNESLSYIKGKYLDIQNQRALVKCILQ